MKNTVIAVFALLCGGFAPSAIAADEAKTSNAAAAAPASLLLDKTVGQWAGPMADPSSNFYFNYNMDFAAHKEGDKVMARMKSPNAKKEPTGELKVMGGKIVGDFSYDKVGLILTLEFVDDNTMSAVLLVKREGYQDGTRTGQLMRKK